MVKQTFLMVCAGGPNDRCTGHFNAASSGCVDPDANGDQSLQWRYILPDFGSVAKSKNAIYFIAACACCMGFVAIILSKTGVLWHTFRNF
jgi:hypothetical protein